MRRRRASARSCGESQSVLSADLHFEGVADHVDGPMIVMSVAAFSPSPLAGTHLPLPIPMPQRLDEPGATVVLK